ncbi:uncharacterized protein [Nicotiana sylvestris]|uniref:Uncharacterized protein LOC104245458 n=1 Tax=Nicotiana sylvestris TaxID=4096 RepID=A0A1U7Y5G4_NICSY|nr:PREDICTED: uncharacterized protein LOC104245458 [Nicotiana sylvestris]
MREEDIAELKARWGIPGYVDMRPTIGNDIVHFDRPGYCVFYAYPFLIGYTLPLSLLVVDFCRFYEVCPTQLSSYLYKLFLMLLKFERLASREITLDHMLNIFAPQLIRNTMLHMRPRGSKRLVVKMDNRANLRFYENYFYVRTEHIVADPMGFLEKWNFARIRKWVSAILPHTEGVLTWSAFYEKFGRRPLTGRVQRVRAPSLAFRQLTSSACPIAAPSLGLHRGLL